MWNTILSHTNEHKTEIYLYFDIKEDAVLLQIMVELIENCHLVVRNEETLIVLGWSIQFSVGTNSYTLI